jgi:beta-aspartyl-peptidase (threonine type)
MSLWAGLLVSSTAGQATNAAQGQIETAIRQVLKTQSDAWNQGNIDAFMRHYWKSESLTFSSSGNTTRGWQATRDGYKQRYPTPKKMGRLTFNHLEVFALGSDAAYVLGTWHLERADPIGGIFSLVLRRFDGQWLIVHDHTSMNQSTK